MVDVGALKIEICDMGKKIYKCGFVAANDGNISLRLSESEILATPTGISKGDMTPEMISIIDIDGNVLQGKFPPSSELKMHLKVYKSRSDVNAVIHTHSPYATAMAICGIAMDKHITSEFTVLLGTVPVVPYGTPSTDELPNALEPFLDKHDGFLLANHGTLAVGESLKDAWYKMESMEQYAKLYTISHQVGTPVEFSPTEVIKLIEIRKKMGLHGKYPL